MNFPLSWRNGRFARDRDLPPALLPSLSSWTSLWPSSTSVAIGADVLAVAMGGDLGGALGGVLGAAHLAGAEGVAHFAFGGCSVGAAGDNS